MISHNKKTLKIETNRFQYLNDHKVQGMVLMPGTQFLQYGQDFLKELGLGKNVVLNNVEFQKILVLDRNKNYTLELEITDNNDGSFNFTCLDAENGQPYMSCTISKCPDLSSSINADKPELSAISIDKSSDGLPGEKFYKKLNERGNQYGPNFRGIHKIWESTGEGEAIGKLHTPEGLATESHVEGIHPAVLDAATHPLISLGASDDSTVLLAGCDQYKYVSIPGVPTWSYAKIDSIASESFKGDIFVLNENKKIMVYFAGVTFRYLSYKKEVSRAVKKIGISSTFTSDLIEDTLKFWGEQIGYNPKITFAPYNQIFQQLLDPSSILGKNDQDFNVLLVNVEDWIRESEGETSTISKTEIPEDAYTLPNKLKIAHINKYETEYLYNEIFVDKCYLKNGITINDKDTIVDIGANIGMFSLFAKEMAPDAQIYAFEPAPHAFEALETNAKRYGTENMKVNNIGISNQKREAEFTFYEKSSVFSSFNADKKEDEKAVREIVKNMLQNGNAMDEEDLDIFVDELMHDRMKSQSFLCPLKSLSDIIRENSIDKIDLLKIDAEKSEKQILQGIDEEDWPKINQMVIEVHDRQEDTIEEIMTLLDDKGFDLEIEEEQLLQNSGLYNIFAIRKADKNKVDHRPDARVQKLEMKVRQNVEKFVDILKSKVENSSSPYLVMLCPPKPDASLSQEFIRETGDFIASEIEGIANIILVTPEEIFKYYPVEDYYDADGDKLGHISYTVPFYEALGTMITRKLNAYERSPYKVVVLDCDQTIWKGICGEVGAEGIEIDEARKELHLFMQNLRDAGFLLCLCSKNNEEDVLEVFENRKDMPLAKEDIVSWKINWQPKSKNIRELSEELNLGLDSFVFIDDNPVECAEMRANNPEVLTLQLPQDDEEIPQFLKHTWAFDLLNVTGEDKKRTLRYKQNIKRRKFQKSATTLNDFLEGLELNIQLLEPKKEYIPRMSQLTLRTNQFNFTTIRRNQAEIQQVLDAGELESLICEVSDRFGNYGQVGLILFKEKVNSLSVDTFLLSCRVLGRGVEYFLVSELGKIAHNGDIENVEITFLNTKKNKPAFNFINDIAGDYKTPIEGGYCYRIPSSIAKEVSYNPKSMAPATSNNSIHETKNVSKHGMASQTYLSYIAENLNSSEKVSRAVASSQKKKKREAKSEYVPPENNIQKTITEIWQQVLEVDKVGLYDNFSEAGGTSLMAVQLISKLRKAFTRDLSIVSLYENPTVAQMADMLADNGDKTTERLEKVKQKANKRRRNLRRRNR